MNAQRHKTAFTIIELVVIVATVSLLAVMLLPVLATTSTKSQRIICVNNLKETYLAFKIWEGENSDQFPMAISTVNGGGKEYVASYVNQAPPIYSPYSLFQAVSNQLVTPKILYCPADNNPNAAAAGVVANPSPPSTHQGTYSANFNSGVFGDAFISYFVCGDATEAYPGMTIFGDRNIGTSQANTPTAAGVMFSDGPQQCNLSLGAKGSLATWAWTAQDQHLGVGNVALTDGSVARETVNGLRQTLIAATNGLPAADVLGIFYNFP